jgi:hypothetical protein
MSRKLGLYCIAAATALMTFAVVDDAQARGRRNGGSCGSNGGYNSYGSNGSNGSFGGRFRRGRGSWGSNGSFGSYGSNGGYNNGCGSHGGYNHGHNGEVIYEVHEGEESKPVEHEAQYHERSETTYESRDAHHDQDSSRPMPSPEAEERDANRAAAAQSDAAEARVESDAAESAESQADQSQSEAAQQSDQPAQEQPASPQQNPAPPEQPAESTSESGA